MVEENQNNDLSPDSDEVIERSLDDEDCEEAKREMNEEEGIEIL